MAHLEHSPVMGLLVALEQGALSRREVLAATRSVGGTTQVDDERAEEVRWLLECLCQRPDCGTLWLNELADLEDWSHYLTGLISPRWELWGHDETGQDRLVAHYLTHEGAQHRRRALELREHSHYWVKARG